MQDEKIQLPDFIIADFFKASLVEIDTFEDAVLLPISQENGIELQKGSSAEKIKFLGENAKGIVVIVNQPNATFLLENELAFLTNILKACQLNLADIAIINMTHKEISYKTIKDELQTNVLILFDVQPSAIRLPFITPAFQIQNYGECKIMMAPNLDDLNSTDENGKLLKTKLWRSLQTIFNLK